MLSKTQLSMSKLRSPRLSPAADMHEAPDGQVGKSYSCRDSNRHIQRLAEGLGKQELSYHTGSCVASRCEACPWETCQYNTTQPNAQLSDQNSHGKHQKIIIKLTASTTGSFSLFTGVLESLFVEGD